MLVFLDSSVIYNNFHLNSPAFESIKSVGSIVLCEVIIEEISAKHHEKLCESVKKVNLEISSYNTLSENKIAPIALNTIDEESRKYKDFLDMFIIESGMTIPEPYPDVSHEEIVKRAIGKRKPFDSTGRKGYRDFLIWKTLLRLVKTYASETVHFITHNTNDFSDSKDPKNLHADLVADIEHEKIDNNRLKYWSSLQDFVEAVVKPLRVKIDEGEKVKDELLNNRDGFVTPVEEMALSYLKNENLDDYCDIIISGNTANITEIYDFSVDEISEVSALSENEIFVDVRILVDCFVESFIAKSDLAQYTKKEMKHIEVLDFNHDSINAKLGDLKSLTIHAEVVFQPDVGKIKTFEVTEISDNSYCPYCPYDEYDEDDDEEGDN